MIALFDDTYHPVEVMKAAENEIKVKCMEPMKRKIGQDFTRGEYWVWPSRDKIHTIPKSAILTIYPI